jgi:hypothetical protein
MATDDPAFDALVRVWSDENGDLRYPLDVLKALRASGWDVVAATPAPLDGECFVCGEVSVGTFPLCGIHGSRENVATPAPLDVPDDDWQERGNPGDDEQGWQPDVVLPEGTFLPRDRRTRHATPAPLDGCEPHVHDDYCALAASFWMHYRCGYVDCRIVEQHEHGDGQAMRQMTPQEIAIAAAYAEETK